MKTRSLALVLGAALLATTARAQTFEPGDLWIVSQGIDNGVTWLPGIGRVDVPSGATQNVLTAQTTFLAVAAFDPFRNGILLSMSLPNSAIFDVYVVHADGTNAALGVTTTGLQGIAPVGDGRVYFYRNHVPQSVEYFDASNVVHDLLDATGTAPFLLSGAAIERTMIYDPVTNSLFLGTQTSGAPCGVAGLQAAVIRIPLSADGTKVSGTVQTVPLCPFNTFSPTTIINFSDGPGNTIVAVLDNNGNDAVGRMMTIDRTTLAVNTWAVNGPYTGAAATIAGVYSHVFGQVVIDDGFSTLLRRFSLGDSGLGTPWISGAGLSVHADATMIEIPGTVTKGLAPYGTGTPGCHGAQSLSATTSPKVGAANFRFTCTNAPASALGLLLVGNVPDVAGSDPFAFGALLHVNLFLSTFVTGLDLNSNASGFAQSPAPIPISAALIGQTVDAQALWVWTGCFPPSPFGISTSTGLAVTFQP